MAIAVPTVIDRRSLAEHVRAHIKQPILSGRIASGERIREEQLATDLQVSRTPVREALRWLASYGLVRLNPRR